MAVAAIEQRLHPVALSLTIRFGPEQRNAVVGRVVVEDDRKSAVGVAELHIGLPGFATMLLQAFEETVIVVAVAEVKHLRVLRFMQWQVVEEQQSLGNRRGSERSLLPKPVGLVSEAVEVPSSLAA